MRVGIGQDSHRFLEKKSGKPCVIGGVVFEEVPGLDADSDGDVILHALCNAISSISCVPILGGCAVDMCKSGITDSREYVKKALSTLKGKIVHVALTVEGKRPRMQGKCDKIRAYLAQLLHLEIDQIGLTCTSGDGMGDFGQGVGLQCFCIVTAQIQ